LILVEATRAFSPLRSVQDDMLRKATVDKLPGSLTYDDYREDCPYFLRRHHCCDKRPNSQPDNKQLRQAA
jgi:hypothetical protein